jgi:hypothetical protein
VVAYAVKSIKRIKNNKYLRKRRASTEMGGNYFVVVVECNRGAGFEVESEISRVDQEKR